MLSRLCRLECSSSRVPGVQELNTSREKPAEYGNGEVYRNWTHPAINRILAVSISEMA